MMEEKITVKDILKDNYNDFKNKYWCKVPKDMRKHIDEAVSKALKCSDIEYRILKYENNRVKFWYEDHNDGPKKVIECDVFEFIGKITQHIAPFRRNENRRRLVLD